jgi:Subtilase family
MNVQKLLSKIALLSVLLIPLSAPALVMRPNGPEPVIVQIKESLRTSDELDNRLNELTSLRSQNHLSVVKWWAGSKLLVLLSFPANFTERQATTVIAKLRQLAAVEKVVEVSAFNLHFRSGDFVREYGPNDSIPDVARRGFDADRIGKQAPAVPDQVTLLQTPHIPNRLIVGWKEEYIWKADTSGFAQRMAEFHRNAGCRVVREFRYSPTKLSQVLEFDDPTSLADKLKRYMDSGWVAYAQPDYVYHTTAVPNDPVYSSYPGPQWTLPIIHAPEAWDMFPNATKGDPSVIIAVGDTGARVNGPPAFPNATPHPDFKDNLWSGQNNGDMHNFIYQSTNVDDDYATQHGSNVASIIGAQGNNGSYMSGVAWDTSLMILKVVDSQDSSNSDAICRRHLLCGAKWRHCD